MDFMEIKMMMMMMITCVQNTGRITTKILLERTVPYGEF
jgi:hypothetical protein